LGHRILSPQHSFVWLQYWQFAIDGVKPLVHVAIDGVEPLVHIVAEGVDSLIQIRNVVLLL
jgi:hypothetical protein